MIEWRTNSNGKKFAVVETKRCGACGMFASGNLKVEGSPVCKKCYAQDQKFEKMKSKSFARKGDTKLCAQPGCGMHYSWGQGQEHYRVHHRSKV